MLPRGLRALPLALGLGLVPTLFLLLFAGCAREERSGEELVIFAASSLEEVLRDAGATFEARSNIRPIFNFAGSNVLALQIEASRAADLFISADEAWMDYLEERDLLRPESRRTVISNRLTVVAASDSAYELTALRDLAALPFRHLALADPAAVPAGRYARASLERVTLAEGTLWQRLESRVAPASDVRAALAMVAARDDAVGIVYRSDAQSSQRVKRLLELPDELTPAIRYSAAALAGSSPRASAFLGFLGGDQAAALFEEHGFARRPTRE